MDNCCCRYCCDSCKDVVWLQNTTMTQDIHSASISKVCTWGIGWVAALPPEPLFKPTTTSRLLRAIVRRLTLDRNCTRCRQQSFSLCRPEQGKRVQHMSVPQAVCVLNECADHSIPRLCDCSWRRLPLSLPDLKTVVLCLQPAGLLEDKALVPYAPLLPSIPFCF